MGETKEKILDVSLDLFSKRGFTAVSIRDICKQVQIKESSIYYHFKNKQAIFDEILNRFQKKANNMMEQFSSSLDSCQENLRDNFYMEVCNHFFVDYLMDEFCNKVIRLMSIEQHNSEEVKKIYDYWVFTCPLNFQSSIFQMLMDKQLIQKEDTEYFAIQYYAPVFLFAQKWLFCGTLSDNNKKSFHQDIYKYIQMFFSKLGGV